MLQRSGISCLPLVVAAARKSNVQSVRRKTTTRSRCCSYSARRSIVSSVHISISDPGQRVGGGGISRSSSCKLHIAQCTSYSAAARADDNAPRGDASAQRRFLRIHRKQSWHCSRTASVFFRASEATDRSETALQGHRCRGSTPSAGPNSNSCARMVRNSSNNVGVEEGWGGGGRAGNLILMP